MQATGLGADQINIHTLFLGGGFGRRGGEDYIEEAVEVAKHMKGTPVKTVWTREDDLQHDTYRPMSYTTFAAGLDADGWRLRCMLGWCVRHSGNRHADRRHSRHEVCDPAFPVRGAFAGCRHPGELLAQRRLFAEHVLHGRFSRRDGCGDGQRSVEYRRKLLANQPRMLGVLNLAAEKAGWGTPLPAGRFRGVAVVSNIGSYNAQVAEVSVTNAR